MTSYFPYYLALFGLLFFITVICCCIKLIDIIDRPVPRDTTMPAWNYANYLQNSPVAILSPNQGDPYIRCAMLAENHGLTVEEYLTATASGPGLYTSTSRDAISAQYGNSAANSASNHLHHSINRHSLPPPPPPAPAPSPIINPPGVSSNLSNSPPIYRIPVPDLAVQPTPSPLNQRSSMTAIAHQPTSSRANRHREAFRDFRQLSLREGRERERELREREMGVHTRPPPRSRSRSSMRERSMDGGREVGGSYPPKYEDICFDV